MVAVVFICSICSLVLEGERKIVVKKGQLNDIVWTGRFFVAVGDSGIVAASENGIEWSIESNAVTMLFDLNAIAWCGGQYVIVGNYGAVVVGDNGKNWSGLRMQALEKDEELYGVICPSVESFFAVGEKGLLVRGSENNIGSDRNIPEHVLYGIIWTDDRYVAVGEQGTIIASRDGVQWQSIKIQSKATLYNIEKIGSHYIIVGEKGTVLISEDAVSWKARDLPWGNGLYDIASSGKEYVIVGDNGIIATSADLMTWTRRDSSVTGCLSGIAFSGDKYVAVGRMGTILFSNDGVLWERAKWLDRMVLTITPTEQRAADGQ